MGAWGFGPYDSDTAAEWIEDLKARTALVKEMKKAFKKPTRTPDEARVAAAMITKAFDARILQEDDLEELIPLAIEALEEIYDSDYTDSYDQPGTVRKNIKKCVASLRSCKKKIMGNR